MFVALFIIKLAASVNMIIFGIHQFLNPQHWNHYLPKGLIFDLKNPDGIIKFHALGNISLAVLWLSGAFPTLFTWLVLTWWVALLPFSFMNDWRNGIRDLSVTMCILASVYLLM